MAPWRTNEVSDFVELTALEDAIIEDTTRCQCCDCLLVLGDSDCLVVEVPQHNGTVASFVLCHVCAVAVHNAYRDWLSEAGICEHGVADGNYCPDCREEHRQTRIAHGDEP